MSDPLRVWAWKFISLPSGAIPGALPAHDIATGSSAIIARFPSQTGTWSATDVPTPNGKTRRHGPVMRTLLMLGFQRQIIVREGGLMTPVSRRKLACGAPPNHIEDHQYI